MQGHLRTDEVGLNVLRCRADMYMKGRDSTPYSITQTLHSGQRMVLHRLCTANIIQLYANFTSGTTYRSTQTLHYARHTVLHCRLYSSAHTLHCGSRNHDINNHTGLCDVSVFTYCTFNFSGSYRFINFAKAAVNYFLYYWFPIPQGSATSIFIFRSTWAWSASYHPRTRR